MPRHLYCRRGFIADAKPKLVAQRRICFYQTDSCADWKCRGLEHSAWRLAMVALPDRGSGPLLLAVGDGPDNPQLWQPLLQALPDLTAQGWRVSQAA